MAVVTPMMMNEELSLCLVVLVVVDDELTQSRCDFCDEYQGCHYHRKFNKLRYQFHSTQTNFSCGRALVHLPQVTVKIRAECKRTISQKHHEKTRFHFSFHHPHLEEYLQWQRNTTRGLTSRMAKARNRSVRT